MQKAGSDDLTETEQASKQERMTTHYSNLARKLNVGLHEVFAAERGNLSLDVLQEVSLHACMYQRFTHVNSCSVHRYDE